MWKFCSAQNIQFSWIERTCTHVFKDVAEFRGRKGESRVADSTGSQAVGQHGADPWLGQVCGQAQAGVGDSSWPSAEGESRGWSLGRLEPGPTLHGSGQNTPYTPAVELAWPPEGKHGLP